MGLIIDVVVSVILWHLFVFSVLGFLDLWIVVWVGRLAFGLCPAFVAGLLQQ